MGFPMRKVVLLLSLILTACGGGGGSNPSPMQPVSTFTELPNVMTVPIPYPQSQITTIQSIDINHDGKDDIVLHIWSKPLVLGIRDTTPCKNELLFLIQQNDGTFIDQTSTYLIGPNDLGGCSMPGVVGDFNKDGYLDIVYAMNQEDGRDQTYPTDMNAQLAAVVSVGSKYTVTKFGIPDWYACTDTLIDNMGNTLVVGNGVNSAGSYLAYGFNLDGSVYTSNMSLPRLNPTTFKFMSTLANKESNILIQPVETNANYTMVEAYVKNNNGWNKIDQMTLYDVVGYFNSISYTNNYMYGAPVELINGNYVSAAIQEICSIKLSPNANPIALFKIGGNILPNYTNNMTVGSTVNYPIYNIFVGLSVIDNQLVKVPVNVPSNNANFNQWSCDVDINNDGYDDIVMNAGTNDGSPLVYLNDHNNNFIQVNKNIFASGINSNSGYTSILHDFNNDGIVDWLIIPTDYNNSLSVNNRFFRGNLVLKN
jgi:FG-GAP-like repeat